MVFNTDKLRGKIIEVYGSLREFCAETNYSYSTLQGKLSNKTYFTQVDIMKFVEWLKLEEEEILLYFFTLKV